MAKNDPKYVRLVPRLSKSVISDVNGSGWSISGLDVKPFPDGTSDRAKAAAKYVRRMLNAGNLEPCSKGEYEEVQEQAAALPVAHATFQEGKFQRAVQEATETIRKSREDAVNSGANGPTGEADVQDEDITEEETPEPDKAKGSSKKAAKSKK